MKSVSIKLLKIFRWNNMVPAIESVTFLPCHPLYYIQVQKKVSLICSPL